MTASPRRRGTRGTVVEVAPETPTARRITLDVPTWPGNDAGSHLDVRLTAPDGYQAQRSYSIASAGEGTRVVLAVDEVPDGEVSPFLVHELAVGDQVEVHGPLGAFFVWHPPEPADSARAGAAHRRRLGRRAALRDALGARRGGRRDRVPAAVLGAHARPTCSSAPSSTRCMGVDYVYTRETPDGVADPRRTGDPRRARGQRSCRPTARRASTSAARRRSSRPSPNWLVDLGHPTTSIRTERFGGS